MVKAAGYDVELVDLFDRDKYPVQPSFILLAKKDKTKNVKYVLLFSIGSYLVGLISFLLMKLTTCDILSLGMYSFFAIKSKWTRRK